jgi:hypothetical protein
VEPKEFLKKWKLTKEELAIVTGKTGETVRGWLIETDKARPPSLDVIERLSLLDHLWSSWQKEDQLPSQFRAMYNLVRSREEMGKSYPSDDS